VRLVTHKVVVVVNKTGRDTRRSRRDRERKAAPTIGRHQASPLPTHELMASAERELTQRHELRRATRRSTTSTATPAPLVPYP